MQPFKSSTGETVYYPREGAPGAFPVFMPNPLPRELPELEVATHAELAVAAAAIGELNGLTGALPNPDLFLAMYVRKEALLSSAIESIASTLDDVLEYEEEPGTNREAAAIVHYVAALNRGLAAVAAGNKISLPLIQELHGILMQDDPDGDSTPGRFRTDLVRIARKGTVSFHEAIYVPPPVERMDQNLMNLAYYMNEFQGHPPLVRVAMAHAYFETIHPFRDGNGRIGRMLVALMLARDGLLQRPLIYPSLFLLDNQREYYDRLMAVRERGDWNGWVRFVATALATSAREAARTMRSVLAIHAEMRAYAKDLPKSPARLAQVLFETPMLSVNGARVRLGVTYNPANDALRRLERDGWVSEATNRKRDRIYRFDRYLNALELAGENEPGLKTHPRPAPG